MRQYYTDLLNKLKLLDKKKLLLLGAGGIIILYLDFAFILKLQFNWLKDTSPKVVKLKTDINNLTRELANIKALEGKQAQTKQKAVLKAKKIISEEQIPLLLEHISALANENNISIIKISPSKEAGKASSNIKFSVALITLEFSCSYHHLGKFINTLENTEEFIVVDEIKINRSSADYLRQNVNLALRVYVKK